MGDYLKDKVAIVTGSGRGIGRAHAMALAAEGAKVVVNDPGVERNGSGGTIAPADEVVALIRENGGDAIANYNSVAVFDEAAELIKTATDHYGRLDILVSNSGAFDGAPVDEPTMEQWQRVLQVNVTGPFLGAREAFRIMKKQGGGRIINIGSISAQRPRHSRRPTARASTP